MNLSKSLMGIVAVSGLALSARADDELAQRATWTTPAPAAIKAELDQWLQTRKLDDATKAKLDALWPAPAVTLNGAELLDRVLTAAAAIEEEVKKVVTHCGAAQATVPQPKFPCLSNDASKSASEKLPPLVRNNLRLLYGRWLSQHNLVDESLEQLHGLRPADVVDPATLLFYQGLAAHRLLKKDDCLAAVSKLLENEDSIPIRYSRVAHLMEADMKPLKTDSLDEVARLMNDVERRLNLGRAGKKVRDQEDEVVAKLDKMIEELEKQQQQGGGGGGAGAGGSNSPSSPMQDSQPGGQKGPGNVDPRRLAQGPGWGNLPPKERQETLQNITKDLPAHYREVIEEYFKKLAKDTPK